MSVDVLTVTDIRPAVADAYTLETRSALAEVVPPPPLAALPEQVRVAGTTSAGGESWSDGWEAEDEYELPSGDSGIAASARTIDRRLAVHQAIVDDADWSDVEINLPYPGRLWARSFREEFDASRHLEELLLAAMREGYTSLHDIESFLSNTPSGLPDERLGQHLVATLEDIGILVENESLFPSSCLAPEASVGKTGYDRSVVREVLEFLDEQATSLPDIGLLEIETRRSLPPSDEDERRMFLRHQACLDVIIRLAAPHPAGRSVILDWAHGLDSGIFSVTDLTSRGGNGFEKEREPEHDGPSEIALLARALRQAPSVEQDGLCAQKIIALSLTPPRVIELAERVCSARMTVFPPSNGSLQETGLSSGSSSTPNETGRMTWTGGVSPVDVPATIVHLDKAMRAYRDARDLILMANLRLVVWQARRYAGSPIPIADLVQEGIIGLLRAIERFDPDRGSRFGTYAIWWIRQSMTKSLADKERTIRIPVHLLDNHRKLRKIRDLLHSRLGREPDAEELAAASGQEAAVVRRIERAEIEVVSLEQLLHHEMEDAWDEEPTDAQSADIIGFEQSPLDTLLHADLRRCLVHGLRQLDPRARKILILRYGLDDDQPRTLEEIGQLYGVTRERIRQIEAKAIKRIRRMLPTKQFEAMQP